MAGDVSKSVSERDAIRVLCDHLQGTSTPTTIHSFNDGNCHSQEYAIQTLDAAVAKAVGKPEVILEETVIEAPARARKRELVTSCIAAMCMIGLVGTMFV